MTQTEALRLALEALELVSIEFVCNGAHHAKKDRHEWLDPCPIVDRYKEAITAIKAALEAKDEPVAWRHTKIDGVAVPHRPADLDKHPERWEALYKTPPSCPTCEALARTVMLDQTGHDTTPPQRKPLTDEEIRKWWASENGLEDCDMCKIDDFILVARAIEAKLKEKNT